MHRILTAKLDGLNERRLTEADLDRLCERDSIEVLSRDVGTSFYMAAGERFFVVIPTRLRGLEREFAVWHEIGHHLLHGGREAGPQAFWFGLIESRNEVEANAFATIALVPRPALLNHDWLDEHPSRFARRLWEDRQRLYFLYGL